jgi:hypothetical protein
MPFCHVLASSALYAHISPMFTIVVNSPSLMMLNEELDKFEATSVRLGERHAYALDFPLICKYLLISAWIASRNPNIDAEIKDRRRRRKSSQSEAARLEEDAFSPPSLWRIPKLLSILDHVLAGNEEEDETNATSAPDSEKSQEALQSIRSQISVAQSSLLENLTHETSMKVDVTQLSGQDADSQISVWDKVSFDQGAMLDLNQLSCLAPSSQTSDVDLPASQSTNNTQQRQHQHDAKHFDSSGLFPLLWEAGKGHASQMEILSQIGVLEQIGLFVRNAATTSKTTRTRSEYRCGYDSTFAYQIADSINFPLWGFL